MTRRFSKRVLYLLVIAIIVDAVVHRRRKSSMVRSHREELMTWEDEGGMPG